MVLITLSMAHYKRIGFRVEKGNAVTYFCVFGTCMRPLKKKIICCIFTFTRKKKKLSHRMPKTFHYVCAMLQGHIMY